MSRIKVSALVGGVIRGIQQFYRGRGVPSSAVGQNPSFSSFLVTLRRIYSCCYTLNKLDASTNGNYAIYRNPWALSSALATLGTLQPRALGFLNRVVPLVSASNYYLVIQTDQSKSPTMHRQLTLNLQLKLYAVQCLAQGSRLLTHTS